MRKLLIVIMAISIIAGVSNAASGSILVDSKENAGVDYTSGLDVNFEAGTYEFFVDSGAWSTDDGWTWEWNVNIYRPDTETEYTLGTFNTFSTGTEARNANSSATVELALSEGEKLYFYNYDNFGGTSNNKGVVGIRVDFTSPVPVIPEPVSSILFVTGGAFLAGRRYLTRKRIDS